MRRRLLRDRWRSVRRAGAASARGLCPGWAGVQHPRALGAHVEPAQGAEAVPRAQALSQGVLQVPSRATDRRYHPVRGAEPSATDRERLRLGHTATATATGGRGLVPEGAWLGCGMGRSGTAGAEAILGLPLMGTTRLPWTQLRIQAPEPFSRGCQRPGPQPTQGAQPLGQPRTPPAVPAPWAARCLTMPQIRSLPRPR